MTIHPVRRAAKPRYPDSYSVEADRALLSCRPSRWAYAPLVGSVLAATLVLSGCVSPPAGASFGPHTASPSTTPTLSPTIAPAAGPSGTPASKVARVPLFEYGKGAGAIGCVSVSSPAFLSEEEAYDVLAQECEAAGVPLAKEEEDRTAVRPVMNLYLTAQESVLSTQSGTVRVDAEVAGVPVVYVSRQDVEDWRDPKPTRMTSVTGYDMKSAAASLLENNEGFAVLYDPSGYGEMKRPADDMDKARAQAEDEARVKALEDLRRQVRAFLDWLRAEGVI